MTAIREGKAAGTLTDAQVIEAHKSVGLQQLQLAVTKPDLIPAIMQKLGIPL